MQSEDKLNQGNLKSALDTLSEWKVADYNSTGGVALERTFKFKSFSDVLVFMSGLATEIDAMDHHPDWQNVYNKLTVRLTSHDAGDQITERDVKLAKLFDEHYKRFI